MCVCICLKEVEYFISVHHVFNFRSHVSSSLKLESGASLLLCTYIQYKRGGLINLSCHVYECLYSLPTFLIKVGLFLQQAL